LTARAAIMTKHVTHDTQEDLLLRVGGSILCEARYTDSGKKLIIDLSGGSIQVVLVRSGTCWVREDRKVGGHSNECC
jgi:hypothetical protein